MTEATFGLDFMEFSLENALEFWQSTHQKSQEATRAHIANREVLSILGLQIPMDSENTFESRCTNASADAMDDLFRNHREPLSSTAMPRFQPLMLAQSWNDEHVPELESPQLRIAPATDPMPKFNIHGSSFNVGLPQLGTSNGPTNNRITYSQLNGLAPNTHYTVNSLAILPGIEPRLPPEPNSLPRSMDCNSALMLEVPSESKALSCLADGVDNLSGSVLWDFNPDTEDFRHLDPWAKQTTRLAQTGVGLNGSVFFEEFASSNNKFDHQSKYMSEDLVPGTTRYPPVHHLQKPLRNNRMHKSNPRAREVPDSLKQEKSTLGRGKACRWCKRRKERCSRNAVGSPCQTCCRRYGLDSAIRICVKYEERAFDRRKSMYRFYCYDETSVDSREIWGEPREVHIGLHFMTSGDKLSYLPNSPGLKVVVRDLVPSKTPVTMTVPQNNFNKKLFQQAHSILFCALGDSASHASIRENLEQYWAAPSSMNEYHIEEIPPLNELVDWAVGVNQQWRLFRPWWINYVLHTFLVEYVESKPADDLTEMVKRVLTILSFGDGHSYWLAQDSTKLKQAMSGTLPGERPDGAQHLHRSAAWHLLNDCEVSAIAQLQILRAAAQAISDLEHIVLKDVDNFVYSHGTTSHGDPLILALCIRSLMLYYRHRALELTPDTTRFDWIDNVDREGPNLEADRQRRQCVQMYEQLARHYAFAFRGSLSPFHEDWEEERHLEILGNNPRLVDLLQEIKYAEKYFWHHNMNADFDFVYRRLFIEHTDKKQSTLANGWAKKPDERLPSTANSEIQIMELNIDDDGDYRSNHHDIGKSDDGDFSLSDSTMVDHDRQRGIYDHQTSLLHTQPPEDQIRNGSNSTEKMDSKSQHFDKVFSLIDHLLRLLAPASYSQWSRFAQILDLVVQAARSNHSIHDSSSDGASSSNPTDSAVHCYNCSIDCECHPWDGHNDDEQPRAYVVASFHRAFTEAQCCRHWHELDIWLQDVERFLDDFFLLDVMS